MSIATTRSPLCHRRFMRHFRELTRHINRGEYKKAEQCILEYQHRRGEPEPEWERWYDLVDALIADPPHLHRNESKFLCDIQKRLDHGVLPTQKQSEWLQRISRRRRP